VHVRRANCCGILVCNSREEPLNLGMLDYFQTLVQQAQAGATDGAQAALHLSALQWIESTAATTASAAAEEHKSPTLGEALKERKKAEAQRAGLARKNEQHSNKIRELNRHLASENDALAKVVEEQASAEILFLEAEARVLLAQGLTKDQQAAEMELDSDEAKVESDILSLQTRIVAAERAHKAATDDMERQQAAAMQIQSDLLGKRKKVDADVQARIDAAKVVDQANLQAAEVEQAAKAASLLQARQQLEGAAATAQGSAAVPAAVPAASAQSEQVRSRSPERVRKLKKGK
jgi:hypothetical protein